jgi:hypothetical protein
VSARRGCDVRMQPTIFLVHSSSTMSKRLANGHGSSKTPDTRKAASVKLSSSDDHSSSENVEHDDVAGSNEESASDNSSLPNTSNGSAVIEPDSSKQDASDTDTEEEEDSGEGEEENDDVSSGHEDINADSSKLDASDPDTEEEEDSDDGEEENDDGSSGDEENSENAENDSGDSSASDEKHKADSKGQVLVPSFQLPFSIEQDESSRYELWTIRVPCSLASDPTQLAELLQGQTVSIANSASSSSAAAASQPFPKLASTSAGNSAKYPPDRSSWCQLEWGNSTENESFRMLLPANANSTSTVRPPNAPRAESMLHPLPVPFKRHLNLVELASSMPRHELAPPVELQPPPIVTNMAMSTSKGTASREVAQRQKYAQIGTTIESRQVRRAYSQVPQRDGLKRRWQPIGGSAKSMAAARSGYRKRSRSLSEASVSVSTIQHLQQPQQSMRAAAAGTQVKLEPTVSTTAAVKSSHADEESDHENGGTVKSKKEKKRLKKEMKKLKKAIKDEK